MRIDNREVRSMCPSEDRELKPQGCKNCSRGKLQEVRYTKLFAEGIERDDYYPVYLCWDCVCAYFNADPLPDNCKNVFEI